MEPTLGNAALDSGTWPTFRKTISVIVVSSQYQTIFKWNTAVWTNDNLIASSNKLFSLIKITKWNAHVVHMAKHIKMVGPLFGGGPWPPLNPALWLLKTVFFPQNPKSSLRAWRSPHQFGTQGLLFVVGELTSSGRSPIGIKVVVGLQSCA